MATDLLKQLEEENEKLREMMGFGESATPTATGASAVALSTISDEEANEATGLLNSFMKGRLSSTPPTETFDDYFKKTVRPATEFLQDFTRGFLASGRGQRVITTREEQYERYKDYVSRQDKIRQMERLELNGKVQSAVQLLKMKETATRASANLNQKDDHFNKKLKLDEVTTVMNSSIKLAQLNLTAEKTEAQIGEIKQRTEKLRKEISKNPILQMAAEVIQNGGDNPLDPEVLSSKVLPMVSQLVEAMEKNKKVAQAFSFRPRPITYKDGFGRLRAATLTPDGESIDITPGSNFAGQIMAEPIREFEEGELKEIRAGEKTAETMNVLMRNMTALPFDELMQNIGVAVAFKGEMPRIIADNTLTQKQKEFLADLTDIALAKRKEGTGLQATDRELTVFERTLPSVGAPPETLIGIISTKAALMNASMLRTKLGINPNDLDLTPVLQAYEQNLIKVIQQARGGDETVYRNMKIPSAESIVRAAAIAAGRKDILDKMERLKQDGVSF